jgi:hypothetical protein
MAEPPPDQHEPRALQVGLVPLPRAMQVALVALFFAPLALITELEDPDPPVRTSAQLALVLWCFGAAGYLGAWRAGAVACAVHVAVAFHIKHEWSHAAAWEHTRATGGFGDGIFVNYALVAVWLADAVWPARSGWRWWLVRGFVAFVMVNAAVVFGSWHARWVFVTALMLALRMRIHVPWPYPRGYR